MNYLNIHTHSLSADGSIVVLNSGTDDVPGSAPVSAGIHPADIDKPGLTERWLELEKLAFKKNVIAIGECGLDRLIDISLQVQEDVFRRQIIIAEKVRKPLIIHCVKAFDDLIRIKKESKASVPFIIHGFNNNEQIAEQLLKNGCYLSFGKALLAEGSNAQKAIALCDHSNYFLETDNAPVSIKSIFDKASELKHMSVEELKEKMMLNFKTVFKYG